MTGLVYAQCVRVGVATSYPRLPMFAASGKRVFTKLAVIAHPNMPPAVASLKYHAELAMSDATSDCVLFNEGKGGVTDLSFEKRSSKEGVKKVVSIHYKMDTEGIKSYRKAAAALSDIPSVELFYTPHFGQSRITFEFDSFFDMLADQKMGLTLSFPQLALLPPPPPVDLEH